MKSRLMIIFLCTALFTGYGAKAQATKAPSGEAIPAKFRGNWALPDCRSFEEAMIVTPHFTLRADKDGSRFWPARVVRQMKDYTLLSLEGRENPARVEVDGVLKIGNLPDGPPATWPQTWEDLGLDSRREYMGCADIPAIVPDPLVRVMNSLDKIESACGAGYTADCKKVLFAIADTSKNGKVSPAELKRAGMAVAAAALIIEHHTASRETLDKALYQSMRESDRIATHLGNKDMTLKDFDGFLARAGSAPLREALIDISLLIPGLAPSF